MYIQYVSDEKSVSIHVGAVAVGIIGGIIAIYLIFKMIGDLLTQFLVRVHLYKTNRYRPFNLNQLINAL